MITLLHTVKTPSLRGRTLVRELTQLLLAAQWEFPLEKPGK